MSYISQFEEMQHYCMGDVAVLIDLNNFVFVYECCGFFIIFYLLLQFIAEIYRRHIWSRTNSYNRYAFMKLTFYELIEINVLVVPCSFN